MEISLYKTFIGLATLYMVVSKTDSAPTKFASTTTPSSTTTASSTTTPSSTTTASSTTTPSSTTTSNFTTTQTVPLSTCDYTINQCLEEFNDYQCYKFRDFIFGGFHTRPCGDVCRFTSSKYNQAECERYCGRFKSRNISCDRIPTTTTTTTTRTTPTSISTLQKTTAYATTKPARITRMPTTITTLRKTTTSKTTDISTPATTLADSQNVTQQVLPDRKELDWEKLCVFLGVIVVVVTVLLVISVIIHCINCRKGGRMQSRSRSTRLLGDHN